MGFLIFYAGYVVGVALGTIATCWLLKPTEKDDE